LQFIFRYKIVFLFSLLLVLQSRTSAQRMHRMDPHIYDLKQWHFGVSFSTNYGKMKVITANDFIQQDSVLRIVTDGTVGLGLSGLVDLRLSKTFNLRSVPGLNFHQRVMNYEFRDRNDRIPVDAVTFDLPINIKYKSDIHYKYVRFYAVAGGRISYDFNSRATEERGPFKKLVALKPFGASYEMGVGFDFYMPYFKFSPEIKMINSLINQHSPDQYIYSKSLAGLYPRMFQISLYFE